MSFALLCLEEVRGEQHAEEGLVGYLNDPVHVLVLGAKHVCQALNLGSILNMCSDRSNQPTDQPTNQPTTYGQRGS